MYFGTMDVQNVVYNYFGLCVKAVPNLNIENVDIITF
jgi:hypothetical protein